MEKRKTMRAKSTDKQDEQLIEQYKVKLNKYKHKFLGTSLLDY